VGIPRFIHGHNGRGQVRVPKAPRSLCECGCGGFANSGKRFISGHNNVGQRRSAATKAKLREGKLGARNPAYGKRPHNYKGRQVHPDGYIQLVAKGHPFAGRTGLVMEHRLVMEEHLRSADPENPWLTSVDGVLYLCPDAEVHHIDEDKANNVIANLEVLSKADHAGHHLRERGGRAALREGF
jgi:hypothetical protein